MSRLHNAADSGDEILQNQLLLPECEERYLTNDELKEIRKVRARKEKSHARWQKQEATKAARMQDDAE